MNAPRDQARQAPTAVAERFWAWMDAYVDEPHNASYEAVDMERAFDAGREDAAQQPQPAPGDASAIVDGAVKGWLDRRTETALATAPGIDDREQGKRQGIDDLRQRLDDYWYVLTPAILAALGKQPQPAPELDLASNEMRPGELDAVLATVPPCDEISSWGMRCRVVRAHETHRDRDGNRWPGNALSAVYRERARLVAFLAALYPSSIEFADDAPGWWIVFVDTPAGQMSWHIADGDLELFANVGKSTNPVWDGHTTEVKYERLAEMTLRLASTGGVAGIVAAAAAPAAAPELRAAMAETRIYRERLDAQTAAVRALAAGIEASAKATAPSKKSAIEQDIADRLRKLVEGK